MLVEQAIMKLEPYFTVEVKNSAVECIEFKNSKKEDNILELNFYSSQDEEACIKLSNKITDENNTILTTTEGSNFSTTPDGNITTVVNDFVINSYTYNPYDNAYLYYSNPTYTYTYTTTPSYYNCNMYNFTVTYTNSSNFVTFIA